ncbi:DUF4328 domain-containing protein [Streptomyces seoulensis]|uniref:DUF4328 domain-containing protein n=1 Tax=Streptomyces seoulensis TaxID=73044 RepID=A0A4P6U4C1_STRSO|nr:DUF4328 domain-containing protein [Streptomyces seoulensis]QBJ94177.1 DUF4328 domain-containing protein [Streptomyces seoulensis]
MDNALETPPAPADPRASDTLARLAAGALLLTGAGWLARAVWEIRLYGAGEPASGVPDQGDGVHRPLTSLENSYHLVSTAGSLLTLLCAAAFLMWLGRVRDNARALSGRPPKYAGVWVYLGWVVPVVNLWFPRGIVADAYRASAPGARLPVVVNVWWGLWLAGLFGGFLQQRDTDSVIARAYSEIGPLVAADLAVAGAAVAGALMVRTVTAAQTARPARA